jgi:hypothetical protein
LTGAGVGGSAADSRPRVALRSSGGPDGACSKITAAVNVNASAGELAPQVCFRFSWHPDDHAVALSVDWRALQLLCGYEAVLVAALSECMVGEGAPVVVRRPAAVKVSAVRLGLDH